MTATSDRPQQTVHVRDCAPCDAARAVVDELATKFDPLGNWPDVEIGGTSVQQWAVATVARVLHQFPIGGAR